MQTPTVGRRVWYWPTENEKSYPHNQPFDAGIAHVNPDGTINVSIIGDNGYPLPPRQNVTLCEQPIGAAPGDCSWMPYQVAKAKAESHIGMVGEAEPQSPT